MQANSQLKILIVDPEVTFVESLSKLFETEGYQPFVADCAVIGLEQFRTHNPDLVLLSTALSDRSAIELCREVRQHGNVPVVFVSADSTLDQKVEAFENGADDYLARPFRGRELMLRVRAKLRRRSAPETSMNYQGISLDTSSHVVKINGKELELSLKERQLLEVFMRRPHRVITRDQLLLSVWGSKDNYTKNVLDVYVSGLRAKLGDKNRSLIRTVRSVGYCLG
jgi:two-component system response regulator RegX3